MSTLSDALRQGVGALILHMGKTITVTRLTEGNYDADAQTISGSTTTSTSVRAALLPYRHHEIDGTRIQNTDKKLVMEIGALAAAPKAGDTIVDGADSYTVVDDAKVYEASGVHLAYVAQVRIVGRTAQAA